MVAKQEINGHKWWVWAVERIGLPSAFCAVLLYGIHTMWKDGQRATERHIESLSRQVEYGKHIEESEEYIAENKKLILSNSALIANNAKMLEALLENEKTEHKILQEIADASTNNAKQLEQAYTLMAPVAAQRAEMIRLLSDIKTALNGKKE